MEKRVERDIINYLYYDLNRLRFIVKDEIFEFDIQASAHHFIKNNLNNNFDITREKRKIDLVIDKKNDVGEIISTDIIEIKSFIKKNEYFALKKIKKDLEDLKMKASEHTNSYFLLAIKESHLTKKIKDDDINFIDALNGKVKHVIFFKSVKTRIIRSLRTQFQDQSIHKSQVRIFMFQILL
jgi:hypothetical protein